TVLRARPNAPMYFDDDQIARARLPMSVAPAEEDSASSTMKGRIAEAASAETSCARDSTASVVAWASPTTPSRETIGWIAGAADSRAQKPSPAARSRHP